jgi:hypothetical protein
VACEETWFFGQLDLVGLRLANVRRGDWREHRSYAITQDYVVANKA